MRFREIEFKGYTLRLCDLPSHYMLDHNGHRSKEHRAMVLRHWKIRKDGVTVTTAQTLARAKEKATRLAMDDLFRKGMEQ